MIQRGWGKMIQSEILYSLENDAVFLKIGRKSGCSFSEYQLVTLKLVPAVNLV